MINKRAFSLLNIVIIICVVILGGIVFKNYYPKAVPSQSEQITKNKESENIEVKRDFINQVSNEAEEKKDEVKTVEKASALPDPSTLPTLTAKTFNQPLASEPVIPAHNGHFENIKYGYMVDFPPEWTLKDTQLDNVSIGRIPPKDNIGAINFLISNGSVEGEIAKLKQELKQYSGMVTLEEDEISVAGEKTKRLILSNIINKTKNYYLIFSHNSITYIIKYPYQSDDFFKKVETVLSNFNFINK